MKKERGIKGVQIGHYKQQNGCWPVALPTNEIHSLYWMGNE